MKVIGITGGIGAGKTEVLNYIRQHYKCRIYLADQVAHLVKEPGTECYDRLVELLGTDILQPDGYIDKGLMAQRIFEDVRLLEQVNAIVHPAVRSYLLERLAQAMDNPQVELFFVEAALLIEAGYEQIVDELWYIYADAEVRRQRLRLARGYSEEKITSIMDKQLSDEMFREHCDFVIDNSGTLEESIKQIKDKLEAYTWQE